MVGEKQTLFEQLSGLPKKAKLVTSGSIGVGLIMMLINLRVDPVQAQVDRVSKRSDDGLSRVESKIDAILLLELGASKEDIMSRLEKIEDEKRIKTGSRGNLDLGKLKPPQTGE